MRQRQSPDKLNRASFLKFLRHIGFIRPTAVCPCPWLFLCAPGPVSTILLFPLHGRRAAIVPPVALLQLQWAGNPRGPAMMGRGKTPCANALNARNVPTRSDAWSEVP